MFLVARQRLILAACLLTGSATAAFGQLTSGEPASMSSVTQGTVLTTPISSAATVSLSTSAIADVPGSDVNVDILGLDKELTSKSDVSSEALQPLPRPDMNGASFGRSNSFMFTAGFGIDAFSRFDASHESVLARGVGESDATRAGQAKPSKKDDRETNASPEETEKTSFRVDTTTAMPVTLSAGYGATGTAIHSVARDSAIALGDYEKQDSRSTSTLASRVKTPSGNATLSASGFPDSTMGTALLSPPDAQVSDRSAPADEGLAFGSFDLNNKTFLNPSLTAHRGEFFQRDRVRRKQDQEAAKQMGLPSTQITNGLADRGGIQKEHGLDSGLGMKSIQSKPLSNGLTSDPLSVQLYSPN
ncbi:hypothetical protein [Silvibacterium sp.]|uniref:hypothetical protein n=1 Tax=Silvibacterium sp. TaxID=1964179 RepID=UPI0039E56528